MGIPFYPQASSLLISLLPSAAHKIELTIVVSNVDGFVLQENACPQPYRV